MKARIAPFVIVAVVIGAAGLSLLHADGASAPASESVAIPAAAAAAPAMPMAPLLPPNHPPIGGTSSPQDVHAMPGSMEPATDEAPAMGWKVPAGWQTAPNPNAMRIATYHPAADTETEVTVARAGGSTDANIERWVGQFDDAGLDKRTERTVRGLAVKIVEVGGTYVGGGMMPGAPSVPRRNWTLVGAVIETPGTHYFFKLLGPAATVRTARASFDALIGSIAPR